MIKGFVINDCRCQQSVDISSVIIEECNDAEVHHLQVNTAYCDYSLIITNILGDSHFSYLLCDTNIVLALLETETDKKHHNIFIDHYQVKPKYYKSVGCIYAALEVHIYQISYQVTVQLSNATFQNTKTYFLYVENTGNLQIDFFIINSQFYFNHEDLISLTSYNHIVISNCVFLHNTSPMLIQAYDTSITIFNSTFYYNVQALKIAATNILVNVTIQNTNFTYATCSLDHDKCRDFIDVLWKEGVISLDHPEGLVFFAMVKTFVAEGD